MEWIIIILVVVFFGTMLLGGDTEDAVGNTAMTGMAGLGCAWQLFWTGASIFFFLFIVQACFG